MDTGPVVKIALLVYPVTFVIGKSTFGYVNEATNPPYRVFVADTDVALTNLSNQTFALLFFCCER